MSNGTEKQARVITTILSALTEYDDPADRRYIMVCAVASMFRMDKRDPSELAGFIADIIRVIAALEENERKPS
jgi:F420-dependent methylenetetrahydromethanopterin dehydrogenase